MKPQQNNELLTAFWNPFPLSRSFSGADFFSGIMNTYREAIFIDCKSDCRPNIKKLLRDADLVILLLPQNPRLLRPFLLNPFEKFKNTIYVLYDYFPDAQPNVGQLIQQYRIPPECLGVIPYNPRFNEALRKEKTQRYIESHCMCLPYEESIHFANELSRTCFIIKQMMEKIMNGT